MIEDCAQSIDSFYKNKETELLVILHYSVLSSEKPLP